MRPMCGEESIPQAHVGPSSMQVHDGSVPQPGLCYWPMATDTETHCTGVYGCRDESLHIILGIGVPRLIRGHQLPGVVLNVLL